MLHFDRFSQFKMLFSVLLAISLEFCGMLYKLNQVIFLSQGKTISWRCSPRNLLMSFLLQMLGVFIIIQSHQKLIRKKALFEFAVCCGDHNVVKWLN